MSWWTVSIGIVVSFILSLVAVPLMIKIGHQYKILDLPGAHKRHKKPTPPLGGAALFVVSWSSVALMLLLFPSMLDALQDSLLYIFCGHLIIFLVGLSDDLSPLSAWIKLLAQIGCGLLLYLGGLRVELLTTPFGSVDIGYLSILLTVGWVVVLTNAINLIDGLDGLAAGVSLIGAITILFIGQFYQVGGGLVFILILVGFLSLFLVFNWYPATIFLGDSGSMQIGYLFAVFSLMIRLKSYTAAALYIPLLALGVPLMEMATSFTRRLLTGKNIMKADRRHLFHYLALSGLTPSKVVWVFYALAVIYGMFALGMFYWDRELVFGILVVFMVVIFIGFFIFINKLKPIKRLNERD